MIPGSQADFERVWTTRGSYLREVPGFIEFHLLRGPEREDHVLFASHTIWRSRADSLLLDLAREIAEAHVDIMRVRRARTNLIARAFSDGSSGMTRKLPDAVLKFAIKMANRSSFREVDLRKLLQLAYDELNSLPSEESEFPEGSEFPEKSECTHVGIGAELPALDR